MSLRIEQLSIGIEDKVIVRDVTLHVKPGQVHAIMGPNGSGKSSLALTLIGYPGYEIINGNITFFDEKIDKLSMDARARNGIFLAFQQPVAIPGVTVFTFLKEAYRAKFSNDFDLGIFEQKLNVACELVQLDQSFLYRHLNDGFSGGEKKRLELLQLLVLEPKLGILDEIDSGMDIDALSCISQCIAILQKKDPDFMVIIISHNPRIFEYVIPDQVHILKEGRLVSSGDKQLIGQIAANGYQSFDVK